MYALRYRGQYPEAVAQEFDALLSALTQWMTLEHSDEGAHTNESSGTNLVEIGQNTINYAQLQNISAASRVLGRGASTAGDPEELSVAAGLAIVGTTLGVENYAATSWTPSDGSGAGLSFSNVAGTYVRLGPLVVASGTVRYPTTANTSAAVLAGLPATSASTTYRQTGGPVANDVSMALVSQVNISSASCAIINAGTGAAVTNSALSGATLSFTVVYTT